MKIAFVAQDDLSTVIFAGWYARQFQNRADVEFYTICAPGTHAQELDRLGTRRITVPGYRFVNPYRDLRYFVTLLRVFRRERFDVVVTFGTKPNVYGALAARVARVPKIVVAVRGLGRVFADSRRVVDRVLRLAVGVQYRLSCWAASRVWFTNQSDLNYFARAGIVDPAKSFVTTNGVNLHFFCMDRVTPAAVETVRNELAIGADQFVVVMVARLVWAKGIREFVDAARRLVHRRQIKFLLVAPREAGTDAVPPSYLEEAGKQSNMTWLDFRKDVRELYALADVAVLPSYSKEGGYPRALLEPMALGKPVIAADTDECRGPVEEGANGYLVPPRDAQALARRIEELYLDEPKRRRFGERSLEIVQTRFDEDLIGRQVLAQLGIAGRLQSEPLR
jgi:N,N'-diacetylbacillosaminyl-diphospho-undecaprenol alpha-1,3-N-acetylgalactosaminyltransferase